MDAGYDEGRLHRSSTAERVSSACNDWQGKTLPFDSIWSFSGNVFNEGRAPFNVTLPHMLASLSANCVDDYGILPFPKYDGSQENYINLADRYAMLVGIPSTTATPEFSAFMLDLIFSNLYYDTALIYNVSGVNTILNDVLKAKTNNFASKYASIEASALADLDKLVEDILAVGQ